MEIVTWRELLKREMEKQGESGQPLKGCNMDTIGLMSCIGTHWKCEDKKLVAWTKAREYYSTTVDGIVVVTSVKRKKK